MRLAAAQLAAYPPRARELALSHLDLIEKLPLLFVAILLREMISFDWKFPVEQLRLQGELNVLKALDSTGLSTRMQAFASIRLSPALEQSSWVNDPAAFLEHLTAWLWSTGQLDTFRAAAEAYGDFQSIANPMPRPATRRLAMIAIGPGEAGTKQPLFRKLRSQGLYLDRIKPQGAWEALLRTATVRAQDATSPDYQHWYVDGGLAAQAGHLVNLSYGDLTPVRTRLLERMRTAIDQGAEGPEALRSSIARLQPAEIGLGGPGSDSVLSRFTLSLLTEGSGTQIFATTFVQWAARECLRRAQPQTLLLRFAARQTMRPMDAMLAQSGNPVPDLEGSLVDADMAAYYTWINMNRLSGADEMSFLVWLNGGSQAIAIGPSIPKGTTSNSSLTMEQVLSMLVA